MKKACSALIALVVLASVVLAQEPPPPPRPISGTPPTMAAPKPVSEWQPFSSTDGNFSLLLPKKPLEMKQEVQTEIGRVPMKIFVAQNGMVAYMAMYADYPVIFDTPAAVKSSLDGSRELMLSKHGGQVISERDISYGQFPGRELKAQTPDGLVSARMIIVHNRAYMTMVMMPIDDDKNFPQANDTGKYFDSFKLLKEPEAPANLGKMSQLAAAAEKIEPPPDFFDRPVSWREFASADFGFTVQLPSEPFHQTAPLNPNDRSLDIHMWMAKGEDFMAQLVVQPLVMIPREEARRNLIFKGLLNGMLEGGNIELISEKEIRYQNNPGREYKLQLPFGQATGKAFLIGKNVYLLVAFLIGGPEKTEGSAKFFDSFKVTKVQESTLIGDPVQGPPPPPAPVGIKVPPGAINVLGDVLQKNSIRKVEPEYPPIAKAARADGEVKVHVLISEDGKVLDAVVLSGHPLLRDAALQAAKQWEFKPTELSGKPIKVLGVLTFNFALQ